MKCASHHPRRHAAPARTGQVCLPVPPAADGLAALLRDIQSTIPSQDSTALAAAIHAGIARILRLLLAILARLAAGQPLAVAPPSARPPASTR